MAHFFISTTCVFGSLLEYHSQRGLQKAATGGTGVPQHQELFRYSASLPLQTAKGPGPCANLLFGLLPGEEGRAGMQALRHYRRGDPSSEGLEQAAAGSFYDHRWRACPV